MAWGTVSRADTESLNPLQRLAAARGAAALDAVEGARRTYWKAFDPAGLSLLVVEPGRWAVLLNHPKPPAGFQAAGTIPRHKFEEEDPELPPWSVHLTTATASWENPPPRGTVMLEGRPTAVVRPNAASITPANASGWPPTEAVLMHMVGALWRAHRAAVEPDRPFDVMPWAYRAGEEDLALAILEQRILSDVSRISYNEKTMEKYRDLTKTWLAVRRARMAANPAAVAMEEEMEWREGIARYNEATPLVTSWGPGTARRPGLEAADPLYERLKNLVALRINTLNVPVLWYPGDPAQSLAQAGARGAMLAHVVYPLSQKWSQAYFPRDGGAPPPFRRIVEEALYKDAPPDPNAEAQLVAEARKEHGIETLTAILQSAMSEASEGGTVPEGGQHLTVSLGNRALRRYEAGPPAWSWAGPGTVRVEGPLRLVFEGGALDLQAGASALFSAQDAPGNGLDHVTLHLPAGGRLEMGGKAGSLASVQPGRARQGSGRIQAPGVDLSFEDASLKAGAGGFTLSWPGAPSAVTR